MTLKLGEIAPNFTAETTEGELDFYEWAGDEWVVLFSHPADYTPVCTTELGRVAALQDEFAARDVKTIGLSVDPIEDHNDWVGDIEETQNVEVNYPIVADSNREIAETYGMMHPEADDTHTVRSVFLIDPEKKVRFTITYPASTGRNFDEILRAIDSVQETDDHEIATPVDWNPGDRIVVSPDLTDDEEIAETFDNVEELRPYLRMADDPAAE
ncbi:MAG: peroxiredoxin [Bradymonadaceae bacterium]